MPESKSATFLSTPSKLFILATCWASFISFGLIGLYPDRYNTDPHLAINLARHYFFRSDKLAPLFDIETHGFLHAVIYLPIISVLQVLPIPFSVQDGIAIGIVYGLSIGLIALLSFAVSRYFHNRFVSSLISLVIVASVLVHPLDIDFVSPNAELIGSALMLLYWSVLLYRFILPNPFLIAVIVGVLVFHLKYQLLPQLFLLTFLAGLKRIQACKAVVCILLASLLADLLVYRFANGSGISRILSLFSGYVMTVNPEYSGIGKSALMLLPGVLTFYPLFMLAWVFMLNRVCLLGRREGIPRYSGQGLIPCIVLSLVTLVAIVLPGKNFTHYYLLLLPTTVVVMNYALLALGSDSSLHQEWIDSRVPFFRRIRLFPVLVALVPFVVSASALSAFSYLFRGNQRWQSTVLMTPSERRLGAHLYGWTSGYSYGSFGAYPSDPALDLELLRVKFSMKQDSFHARMSASSSRPPYIIDLAAAGNNEILGGLIKPIEALKGLPGSEWARSYELVRKNDSGWLYRRKD